MCLKSEIRMKNILSESSQDSLPYKISLCSALYEGIGNGYYSYFTSGEIEVVSRETWIWT